MTQRLIRIFAVGQSLIEVGRRTFRPDAEMVFATVLILGADRGRRVERDSIAKLLWASEPVSKRRHNLRQVLYKLRGAGVEFGDASGPLVLPREDVWLDYEDRDRSQVDPPSGLDEISSMRFMPGFAPDLSGEFDEWLERLREHAEGQVRLQLVEAISACRREGRWQHVERLARECLQLDPLNEEAHLALAESVALAGGKSKAVAMLDAYMAEVPEANDLRLQAGVLRKRIADRLMTKPIGEVLETTLVGRELAVRSLTTAIHRAKGGLACAHLLWGPSGIGKTRLLEEAAKIAILSGGRVVTQQASRDDRLTPGLSVVRLLRALLDMPGALGVNPAVLDLLHKLTTRPSQVADAPLVEVSDDDLVRVLVDLQRAISEETLLVIAFDDLHHADLLSLHILGRAHACLRTERICLLGASIPMLEVAGLSPEDFHQVDRLTTEATLELAQKFFAATNTTDDRSIVDAAAVASGGLPFVLRETILASALNVSATTTTSVAHTLKKRVQGLSPDARDLLFTCIVLAEHASVSLLIACSELAHIAVERALGELEHEQICTIAPDGRIRTHALWFDVASGLLPTGVSIARRHRIANVLESAAFQSENSTELLLASAAQFETAGDSGRAAGALAKGGVELRNRALAPGAYAAFSRAVAMNPASQHFDQRLVQAVITGWQAHLTDEVASLMSRFGDKLRHCTVITDEERAELDVIRVETPGAVLEYTSAVEALGALRSTQGFSSLQRLRLALTGVQSADHDYDSQSVVAIADLVSDIAPTTIREQHLVRQIEMVRAIATKNISGACEIATSAMETILTERTLYENCRLLLSTRIPFWYDCDFGRVASIVECVRRIVDQYPGTVDSLRTQDVLATHLVDMMDLKSARSILEDLERTALGLQIRGFDRNVTELRTRLLLAEGDSEATDAVIAALLETRELPGRSRYRTFALCNAAVGLARQSNPGTLAPVVHDLRHQWERISAACPFDYPCVALSIGLNALGARTDAITLLNGYFGEVRIAQHPPSPFTNALLAEFDLSPHETI
jgi:DNA-binding SARP family transcriptional activator